MSTGGQIVRFPIERRRPRRLVDLCELIGLFGYSERWWRYRIKEDMPHHCWGHRLRFDPNEVQQWLEKRYGPEAR